MKILLLFTQPNVVPNSCYFLFSVEHTHTHTHTYIYIYMPKGYLEYRIIEKQTAFTQ